MRNLRPVMGVLLPASVAVNAIVLALSRRERRSKTFVLTAGGLGAQVVSLALTAAIELPINARVLTWAPDDPPPDWHAIRDRWATVHTTRTVSAVAGLTCLTAAALRTDPSRQGVPGQLCR